MKLVCPSCGGVASAEAWKNDDLCRETLLVIAKMPNPLPSVCLSYISLFRPGKRGLTWKKALRLSTEIRELVSKGYVHVQGKPDRNCYPSIWAKGMEQMVEQRDYLRLPMASHGYLCKVVWDLADDMDRQNENKAPATRVASTKEFEPIIPDVSKMKPMEAYIQGYREDEPSQEEMEEWYRKQMS